MTDRKLMQQALEKLEFFAHMKSVSEDTARLIAALRERLAQESVAWWDSKLGVFDEKHFDQLQPLYTRPQARERLAQPEQESVKFNCTVVDGAHPEGVPLSQWGRQPLTEAAIRGMCERVPDYDISTHDLIQFARAIEAAHGIKEKNHG